MGKKQSLNFYSISELLFITWDSEGGTGSIYFGDPTLQIRRDQVGGGFQPSNWSNENSPFALMSIVGNYYVVVLLFILHFNSSSIRAAFLVGLA